MFTEIGRSECIEDHVVQFDSSETFFSVTENDARVRIVALGIGGMGQNAMENLARENVAGLEIYSINTDMQALGKCTGSQAVQIGKQRTCGRGAGGDSEVGRLSAEDDIDTLKNIIAGAELVFIAAGMGGGTGTGAAPVIGRICHEMGIMTIGVVTTPMKYEGPRRMEKAKSGLSSMRRVADSLMVVENEKLSTLMNAEDISIINAFKRADGVLVDALKSITRMINLHGYINLDLADLNNVLKRQSDESCGDILIGVGEASGEDRAIQAAKNALDNPLLSKSDINGATNLLVNIAGNEDMGLQEALSAFKIIEEKAGEMDREIFMGVVADKNLGNSLCVTVIANGLGSLKVKACEKHSLEFGSSEVKKIINSDEQCHANNNIQLGWQKKLVPEAKNKIRPLSETPKKNSINNQFSHESNDEASVSINKENGVRFGSQTEGLEKRTIETERPINKRLDKYGLGECQEYFKDDCDNGGNPVISKEIWKTPAGMRRQLLVKPGVVAEKKVVKIDKENDGWRSRVLDDENEVSLIDPGFQAAC